MSPASRKASAKTLNFGLQFLAFEFNTTNTPIYVAKRLYTSPTTEEKCATQNAPDLTGRGRSLNLERETGLEPATLSLGTRHKRSKRA